LPEQYLPKVFSKETLLTEAQVSEFAESIKLQLQRGHLLEINADLIELLIVGLGDRRGLIRRTFAEALGFIGKPAVPALRHALLKHSNVTVRRAAAKTLKLTGDPSALPDLFEALSKDQDPVVQGSAAGAMAIFGEKAVQFLLKVLVEPSSTAMQCGLASWSLSFIGAEAADALLEAAQSKQSTIKAAAIAALGDQIQLLGDEKAKHLVINALNDPAIEVRIEATKLLGKVNDQVWVKPHLIKQLSDTNSDVRKSSALSLMQIKAKDSIQDLKKISLREKSEEVITILKLAISQLSK
tara:strand:+ start:40 stop:930 length:891 start_codon:yes stop_codon:yes gene_type:complete